MAFRSLALVLATLLSAHVAHSAQATLKVQSQMGTTVRTGTATGTSTGSRTMPVFVAPQLTPVQFLIMSSPTERKIVWTELRNMRSTTGRAFPLIDSGLGAPKGIAFDRERGDLYVADSEAMKIFRYSVVVSEDIDEQGQTQYRLSSNGIRLTVMEGRNVSWVALDQSGDIFYSDEGGGTINKISAEVMDMLAGGDFQANELQVIPERELEAMASAAISTALSAGAPEHAAPDDLALAQPHILSLYDASINPRVNTPAGLVSDGLRLFWANGADGTNAGTAVRGEVTPTAPLTLSDGSEPAPFPTHSLMNVSDNNFGIALSNTFCFVSASNGGVGVVYGTRLTGGPVYPFATGLGEPRGMVWDGDGSVFVADTAGSAVFSFPVGRIIENAPLTQAVEFNGAWGVALMSEIDPAFQIRDSAISLFGTNSRVLFAILFAWTAFA